MKGYGPATYGDRIAAVYDERPEVSRRSGETDFLARLVTDGTALELAIGTGRVALPLRAAGVEVHGIDASQAMVDQLRAKPGGADIPVTFGDFAAVEAPGTGYELIYVVFNTFFALTTQADQRRCFENAAARLRPGGRFVIEAFTPDLSRFTRDQCTSLARVEVDGVFLDASTHDPLTQTITTQHVVLRAGEPVALYPVHLRYAWPSELDLMASLAGLELESRSDGWNGAPFTGVAANLVSVWRKPGA